MPRRPILYREVFFETLPDGTMIDLPVALVNTELGAMTEMRSVNQVEFSKYVNIDAQDVSYNKRSPMSRDTVYRLLGTSVTPVPFVNGNS